MANELGTFDCFGQGSPYPTGNCGGNSPASGWRLFEAVTCYDATNVPLTFTVIDDDTNCPVATNIAAGGILGPGTVLSSELLLGSWTLTGQVFDTESGINVNGGSLSAPTNSPFYVLFDPSGTPRLTNTFIFSFGDGGATNASPVSNAPNPSLSNVVSGVWTAMVVLSDNDIDRTNDSLTCTNFFTFTVSNPPPGEIEVLGTNLAPIVAGDSTPTTTDGTDFGVVPALGGFLDHSFTITNLSPTGVIVITNLVIGGPHAGDFTLQSPPAPAIPGGQSTSFTIRFDPSVTAGRTGLVTIVNNDTNENPYTFVIQGLGVPGPIVTNYAATGMAGSNQVSDAEINSGNYSVFMRFFDLSGLVVSPTRPLYDVINPSGTTVVDDALFTNNAPTPTLLNSINFDVPTVAPADIDLGTWQLGWTALDGAGIDVINSTVFRTNGLLTFSVYDDDPTPPEAPSNVVVIPSGWTNNPHFTIAWNAVTTDVS
ncbi:MAG: choice-of-anchor D domain-containing protein, partial [Verrucomicrobiota bacterium]